MEQHEMIALVDQHLKAEFAGDVEGTVAVYTDGDTMIVDQNMDCTVIGEFMGLPDNGRKITLRIMHVFDFRDGLISREQVWLDGGGTIAQLTAP